MKYIALIISALLSFPLDLLADTGKSKFRHELNIVTLNQYLGTSLADLLLTINEDAEDLSSLNDTLVNAIAQVLDNNTESRINAQAKSIAEKSPHVIALQEVFDIRCDTFAGGEALACNNFPGVFNDHLLLTKEALLRFDARYTEIAIQENISLTIPVDVSIPRDGYPDLQLSIRDRDVIFTRDDIAEFAQPSSFLCNITGSFESQSIASTDNDGCRFQANLRIPNPFAAGEISVNRGFVGIDITIERMNYRIVNTHLEIPLPGRFNVQPFQALELINYLTLPIQSLSTISVTPFRLERHAMRGQRLVLVGDFNSGPADLIDPFSPYSILTGNSIPANFQNSTLGVLGGLTDIWNLLPGSPSGFTCCQRSDLSNDQSQHNRRIDLILAYPRPIHVKADLIADEKMPEGKWPCDHAGVSAQLTF